MDTNALLAAVLNRLDEIDRRLGRLETSVDQLQVRKRRFRFRRYSFWERLMRPPMWTFEQYAPKALNLQAFANPKALPANPPSIAIVTPSYNHGRYISATIESVLNQDYPCLDNRVQDGASSDETVSLLAKYSNRIGWRSERDAGQSDAINRGFEGADADIMAYLNSDDTLLPGALAYVADFFAKNPNVDFVYGHRIFIDQDGSEVGRAVLPPHEDKALQYADYIPQETMFWRKRVWQTIGKFDESLQFALDWDFILRAQRAGFKFARLPRFLGCFRVHDKQKTAVNRDQGESEMALLRQTALGFLPTHIQIRKAVAPFILKQFAYHFGYRVGAVRH